MQRKYLIIAVLLMVVVSCKKEAGPGGTGSIKGSIIEEDWNSSFTTKLNTYAGADVDVYIIYGDDDNTFDDRVRTSYDGSYEFNYLQKGIYKIYAYSKDSTGAAIGNPVDQNPDIAKIVTVEITDKGQEIAMPDITILN